MTGVGMLQDQDLEQVLATASCRDADGLSPGATAVARLPVCVFSPPNFFPVYGSFLGLLWGLGGTNRSSFRLGLAVKNSIREE